MLKVRDSIFKALDTARNSLVWRRCKTSLMALLIVALVVIAWSLILTVGTVVWAAIIVFAIGVTIAYGFMRFRQWLDRTVTSMFQVDP